MWGKLAIAVLGSITLAAVLIELFYTGSSLPFMPEPMPVNGSEPAEPQGFYTTCAPYLLDGELLYHCYDTQSYYRL